MLVLERILQPSAEFALAQLLEILGDPSLRRWLSPARTTCTTFTFGPMDILLNSSVEHITSSRKLRVRMSQSCLAAAIAKIRKQPRMRLWRAMECWPRSSDRYMPEACSLSALGCVISTPRAHKSTANIASGLARQRTVTRPNRSGELAHAVTIASAGIVTTRCLPSIISSASVGRVSLNVVRRITIASSLCTIDIPTWFN